MAESLHLKRHQGQLAKASVTQVSIPRGGYQCPRSNLQTERVGGKRYQVQKEAGQESG